MELTVTMTLSDRLFSLLEDKLPNLGRRIEKAVTKEIGAQARKESNLAVAVTPSPRTASPEKQAAATEKEEQNTSPEKGKAEAVKAEVTVTPEPAAAEPEKEQPEAAPKKKEQKTPGERIREIMHRTRQRIEGEDYKENTAGEAYQKYHKALTGRFKALAAVWGVDKPSLLPEEHIEAFGEQCEAIFIDENGMLDTSIPF